MNVVEADATAGDATAGDATAGTEAAADPPDDDLPRLDVDDVVGAGPHDEVEGVIVIVVADDVFDEEN